MQHNQEDFVQHTRKSTSSKLSKSVRRRKAKNMMEYLVEEIGISQMNAQILVKVHECTTKAEVLQLLTSDENGMYRHIFIPGGSGKTCQICEMQQQWHQVRNLGLIEEALSLQHQIQEQSFKNSLLGELLHQDGSSIKMLFQQQQQQQQSEEQSEKMLCQICYLKYPDSSIAQIDGKSHCVCLACMQGYIDQKITSMEIDSIYCPHCGIKFQSQEIKRFASQKAYKVYEQFLKNAQIQKNPNLMWCPNAKCSVVISIQHKKKTFCCPKCQVKICSKCKNLQHPKKSCNSVFKQQIKQWQNSSHIQRCRKCSSLVEKISGCNHMSCSICGHEWCWLCGGNYSQRHFNPFNPFGCAGMQNKNGVGKCRIWVWRFLVFLLLIVAVPACLPLALVFSGPFVVIETFYKKVRYSYRIWKKIAVVIGGFIIGIVFDPFIWIGLIVVFGPKIIQAIREYFRNRRRRQQNSQNRLNQRLINDAIVNSQNIVFD